MAQRGIDVSRWNGKVDYKAVKSVGINSVIIQCGYGMVSSQKDPYFETNFKNAKNAKLRVGAYLYSYATSLAQVRKEAKVCLSWIKGKSFELPIYIDMEEESLTRIGKNMLTQMAKEFCRIIENAGYTAGVYANANWFKNYLDYNSIKKDYSIWLAQYSDKKDFECDIWQYTSQGRIKDNAGYFDMNYIYKNPVVNVKVKKNASLYKYAYKDYVGKTSVTAKRVKKGTVLQWIYDDMFGWSKVKYRGEFYFICNNRLQRQQLSTFEKITLKKDTKVYVVKNNMLKKAKILKKGTKLKVISTVERGKYKGYNYVAKGRTRYYMK